MLGSVMFFRYPLELNPVQSASQLQSNFSCSTSRVHNCLIINANINHHATQPAPSTRPRKHKSCGFLHSPQQIMTWRISLRQNVVSALDRWHKTRWQLTQTQNNLPAYRSVGAFPHLLNRSCAIETAFPMATTLKGFTVYDLSKWAGKCHGKLIAIVLLILVY